MQRKCHHPKYQQTSNQGPQHQEHQLHSPLHHTRTNQQVHKRTTIMLPTRRRQRTRHTRQRSPVRRHRRTHLLLLHHRLQYTTNQHNTQKHHPSTTSRPLQPSRTIQQVSNPHLQTTIQRPLLHITLLRHNQLQPNQAQEPNCSRPRPSTIRPPRTKRNPHRLQ